MSEDERRCKVRRVHVLRELYHDDDAVVFFDGMACVLQASVGVPPSVVLAIFIFLRRLPAAGRSRYQS